MLPMLVMPAGSLSAVPAFRNSVLRAADHARRGMLRIQGAQSHLVQCQETRIHVLDVPGAGPLPTVILLHGLSSCGVDYAALIRNLRRHVRRIVCPDLPGHGFSDPPAPGLSSSDLVDRLHQALELTVPEPAIVFGNSLGGLVALRWAARCPEKDLGLYHASPAGAPSDQGELSKLMSTLAVRDAASARAFVRRALPRAGWTREILAWGVRARLGDPAIQALLCGGLSLTLQPRELHALRVPTTLFWGSEERLLPASHLEFFRAHLPPHLAQIEHVSGFGHAPFLEDPVEIANRLCRFSHTACSAAYRATTTVRARQ